MAKRYGRKRGLERKEKPKRFGAQKRAKKNSDIEEELAHGSTSGSLGDPSDNHSGSMTSEEHDEEEVVYKEPSMYENLLRTIGSGSESLANVCKKIEGGKSESEEEEEDDDDEDEMEDDSENDVDGGSASPRVSREVNVGKKGKFDNTGVSGAVKSKLADDILLGDVEQNEDAESDVETSDTDQEHDFTVDGPNAIDASKSTSSFNIHLEHKLTDEEIENLGKGKWKYGWEVPAFSMPACKWIGTGECFLKDMNWDYGLKLKLYKHWLDIYEKSGGKDFHLSKQSLFFYLCNSYRDILHCNKKPFFAKGAEEDSSVMDAYIIHSLNHVFRSRNLVTKNDVKLGKHSEIAKGEILAAGGFLDHGFTRPKVLILLPLASIAFRVVKRLIQLTPSSQKVNVEHIDRFCNNFGAEDEDNNDQDSKPQKSRKPSDFDLLFGGNNTDSFMIGIKFIRKGIKLYSDFYSSDIIVASPAGLISKIVDAQQVKEKDVDYLSSIEVLVIDHADVIAMQNWSLVDTVVQQLNHIPDNQHGTNVMRIRPWYLDGQAKFYRQTIILGSYLNPDINALFNHRCFNFQGKVKSACEYKGVLPRVLLQVRQIYERFDTDSIANADDARLEYFSKKVFPKIKDSLQGGIMLFVSSYFEFVRVRNFLKSQSASFCLLGDYTAQSDISRSRVWFFEGSRKIMLYTERAHFYHRYKIRGIKNLIIYSCPERKEFYPEIVNMLEGSHDISCTVLFSCFDQLRLERIVGNAAAKRMLKSKNNIFVFHQETDS